MNKVTSKDGTPIAFDKTGHGPALILVGGALSDRRAAAQPAALLARSFTVLAFDRRGRGDSGDTAPYAVQREIEDIAALIREAGGSAFLYGHSSGAALALEAANRVPGIRKLALYEPPFIVDHSRELLPKDYIARLTTLISSGRRGEAVELFMTVAVQVPAPMVAQMRSSPMWDALEKAAHTLAYDQAVMQDRMSGNPLPRNAWAEVTMPTLVMVGGASPGWWQTSTRELAEILPNARHQTIPGQNHGVEASVLVPVLEGFFAG